MNASILLTGATGYIGGRLLRSLEEGGHAVRCLARHPDKVTPTRPTTEVVAGDCLDEASLDRALAGVQSASRDVAVGPFAKPGRDRRGAQGERRSRHRVAVIFRGLLRRIAQRAERGRFLAIALILLTVFMMTPVHAQQEAPVRTVEAVNLDRYLGDWFEIGRFPNRFQKTCVSDVRARYARRADGRIDVINRCQTKDGLNEAQGVARVVDRRTSAKLKVRFAPAFLSWLPAVWGDYWILGLADDYTWAVVGSPDRQYLWILARAPVLGDDQFTLALRAARDNGFDMARLVKTSQTASQPVQRQMESGRTRTFSHRAQADARTAHCADDPDPPSPPGSRCGAPISAPSRPLKTRSVRAFQPPGTGARAAPARQTPE